MEGNLEIQVIKWPLVKPTIGLKQSRPDRFSLSHHLADRELERIRFNRALDDHELTEFPLRIGATGFLGQP